MKKTLVIVESPTKAKTISKFLGSQYTVESSFGHLRDLPKSKMGVDIENHFLPHYIIPRDKSKKASELKEKAKKADTIYFATDADREGEAISWHLAQILGVKPEEAKRITFHEITKNSILHALENPRTIDLNLVDSQQARRILDRLVGYELSPFLWKKVAKGLSAGRVQSVAVRLIVEREREIQKFIKEEYWSIEGIFSSLDSKEKSFPSKLFKIDAKSLEKFDIKDEKHANEILTGVKNSKDFSIDSIERKSKKKTPPPPFITSTLQQQANNKLGFSAKQTMMIAQQLYEGIDIGEEGSTGLITYMRTDSVTMSAEFLTQTGEYIAHHFGKEYALPTPRFYSKKSKLAQEAHEAIRPTSILRDPEGIKHFLDARQYKLYKLIWSRACASQMKEATLDQTTVLISDSTKKYTFKSVGSIISFEGYLKVYQTETKENLLPELKDAEKLSLDSVTSDQHFTEPPARYTEASLVKALEENGIGRPSTYAPTIATIQQRNYITKEDRSLAPTEMAMLVNDLLVENFPEIVDYEFTAKMEDNFDEIAQGHQKWQPVIEDFYTPFKKNLTEKYEKVDKKKLTEEKTDVVCEKCGSEMIIKMGRFGKFLACSNYPDCKNTKNINKDGEIEKEETLDRACPECGKPLTYKRGRYGKFIACTGYPDCKFIESEQKLIGIACPKCKVGELGAKKSRRGKYFYGCNKYPACDFAVWDKPTGETCPKCSSLIVEKAKSFNCSNKECDYKKKKEVTEVEK